MKVKVVNLRNLKKKRWNPKLSGFKAYCELLNFPIHIYRLSVLTFINIEHTNKHWLIYWFTNQKQKQNIIINKLSRFPRAKAGFGSCEKTMKRIVQVTSL